MVIDADVGFVKTTWNRVSQCWILGQKKRKEKNGRTNEIDFSNVPVRFLPNNLRRRNEAATDFQPLDVQTMWIDS